MKLLPKTSEYQDVNKNEIKFAKKTRVEVESKGFRQNSPMLITEREDIRPLLGMDWLQKFNWIIRNFQSTTTTTEQSEKLQKISNFEKLTKMNRTTEDIEMEIQPKPGHPLIKQKTRPTPYHSQSHLGKDMNELIQSGHLEKIQNVEEDRFVSPVVLTVNKDISVKIALDS